MRLDLTPPPTHPHSSTPCIFEDRKGREIQLPTPSPSLSPSSCSPSQIRSLPSQKRQRSKNEFTLAEASFLYTRTSEIHRIQYSLDDNFSGCSCVALSAYIKDIFDSSSDTPVVSNEPYICLACWNAYRDGDTLRMDQKSRYRTYYDSQGRALLAINLSCIKDSV